MPNQDKWDRYVKICGAVAAVATILGVLFGGGFGLYTYYSQGKRQLVLMEYNLKKDVYYELVDAATAVAHSTNKADAIQKADKFNIIYMGRAHLFLVDPDVNEAKINFSVGLKAALKPDASWSEHAATLGGLAANLRNACGKVLKIEEIFLKN